MCIFGSDRYDDGNLVGYLRLVVESCGDMGINRAEYGVSRFNEPGFQPQRFLTRGSRSKLLI